jgi:class 3 adenylate cyclase
MEPSQHDVQTRFTKYVFLDVVQFTHDRSVEAQAYIVEQLNELVRDALTKHGLTENDCILLPTGDGLCIGIISSDSPFDAHLLVGLTILELLSDYNNSTSDRMRQFQVRMGINQNVDNVVIDINGRDNLAGTGINTAARLMNAADSNQILLGQAVFDMLQQREKYMNKFMRQTLTVKHNLKLTMYQYVGKGHKGLSVTAPTPNIQTIKFDPKLTKTVAHYFAHAIKHRQFIIANQGSGGHKAEALVILLWFLATDTLGKSEAPETRPYSPITHGAGEKTLEEQLAYYQSQDFWVRNKLARRIVEYDLSSYVPLLSPGTDSSYYYFVTPEGIEKLKNESPEVWHDFELSKFV